MLPHGEHYCWAGDIFWGGEKVSSIGKANLRVSRSWWSLSIGSERGKEMHLFQNNDTRDPSRETLDYT